VWHRGHCQLRLEAHITQAGVSSVFTMLHISHAHAWCGLFATAHSLGALAIETRHDRHESVIGVSKPQAGHCLSRGPHSKAQFAHALQPRRCVAADHRAGGDGLASFAPAMVAAEAADSCAIIISR
jgi:hypothetical protein